MTARPLLAAVLALPVGCLAGLPPLSPAEDARVGLWQRSAWVPSTRERELPREVVSAPGRTDGPNGQISGYCPPRAEVFVLPAGRSLVVRDPCSGPTAFSVREANDERPLSGAAVYGAGGNRRVLPLSDDLILIVMESSGTTLVLADLKAMTAESLRLPKEIPQVRALEVATANGRIFLSGGVIKVVTGSGGCESPPPGMGCDPYVVTEDRSNHQVWSMRPR
ncbi:MAG TPA: hypothetical protein VIG99_06695 [Myxococcaceae bacterium]